MMLSAWRKGDLIEIYGRTIRLTSDGYEKKGKIVCNTDESDTSYIPYIHLIEDAKLITNVNMLSKQERNKRGVIKILKSEKRSILRKIKEIDNLLIQYKK